MRIKGAGAGLFMAGVLHLSYQLSFCLHFWMGCDAPVAQYIGQVASSVFLVVASAIGFGAKFVECIFLCLKGTEGENRYGPNPALPLNSSHVVAPAAGLKLRQRPNALRAARGNRDKSPAGRFHRNRQEARRGGDARGVRRFHRNRPAGPSGWRTRDARHERTRDMRREKASQARAREYYAPNSHAPAPGTAGDL